MDKPYPFFWYELLTSDSAASARFYGEVVGWKIEPYDYSGPAYSVLKVGDRGIGGIMTMPEAPAAAGAKPFWAAYVHVPDTDAAAASIKAAGGGMPPCSPTTFPRSAVSPSSPIRRARCSTCSSPAVPTSRRSRAGTIGSVGWHELYTTDEKAAFDFYSDQFGWKEVRSMDMGEMGTYRVFDFGGGEMGNGGMMNHPPARRTFGLALLFQRRRDRRRGRAGQGRRRRAADGTDGGARRQLGHPGQ